MNEATDPRALLLALEQRAAADPDLRRELEAAAGEFGCDPADPDVQFRLFEWFLLERPSEKLGVPPLIAWSPDSFSPDSSWARLLDSFLGIFRVRPEASGEGAWIDDLWSGRGILAKEVALEPSLAGDVLLFGRFVLIDDEWHAPLPGVVALRAPGLVEAVERDLNARRAEQPRARLSQLECERLFGPFLNRALAEDAADADEAPDAHALEAELMKRLAAAPGWSLERVQELLAAKPVGDVLDHLAFETELDLEAMRRLLPAYRTALVAETEGELVREAGAGEGSHAPPAPPVSEVAEAGAEPASTIGEALARFDADRAEGKGLEELFARLEDDLGLERGTSEEGSFLEGGEPVGPDRTPGFGIWIETYRWERELEGVSLDADQQAELQRLASFVDAESDRRLEAGDLSPGHVVRYLLQHTGAADFPSTRMALAPFLSWAEREQDAPLETFASAFANGALGRRLERVLALNEQLLAAGQEGVQPARVAEVGPLRVAAADQELAAVEGLPETFEDLPVVGDTLLGAWHGGRFHVAALVPAEALTAAPPAVE